MPRAALLTDGHLADNSAKTAHGLLRVSRKYDVVCVIDKPLAGTTADRHVFGAKRVPVVSGVDEALTVVKFDTLIVAVATIGGRLPENFRPHILRALERKIDVVSGLHEQLSEDKEFRRGAKATGATITDIRNMPPIHKLHSFRNLCAKLPCRRVAVMGTDGSIGKRTLAWNLVTEMERGGDRVAMVATGQTGLMQGASHGLPLDAMKSDYMVGELEWHIVQAYEGGHPDTVIIEGQGSITHPAYVCGSRAILSASSPTHVVLVHAPGRKVRRYGQGVIDWPMPSVEQEMHAIEVFSGRRVCAVTVNDEGMTEGEASEYCRTREHALGIPHVYPRKDGVARIRESVLA